MSHPALNALPALRGKRIVITRALDQSRGLHRRLATAGAHPILLPAIRIVAAEQDRLAQALQAVRASDWLVLPSPNAVRVFGTYALSRQPCIAWPRTAVMGKVSQAVLQSEYGIVAACVHDFASSVSLAAQMGIQSWEKVLILGSDRGSGPALARLQADHIHTRRLAVYAVRCHEALDRQMDILAAGFDAIVFTSPSCLQCFLTAAQTRPRLRARLDQAGLICMGPSTATAARNRGLPASAICTEPGEEAIVMQLHHWFAQQEVPD